MKIYFLLAFACNIIISCNAYTENLKKEIISELKEDTRSFTKGSGYHFYNEPTSIDGEVYYIHHSTLECPNIKNGIQRNCYKLDPYYNLFCSHCMDNDLITLWNDRVFPDGYKKK